MQTVSEVESVAAVTGEPRRISAAGVTRTAQRLITLENSTPFGAPGSRRRLVIVADNDRASRAALAAIRWFKASAPRNIRERWDISAVFPSYQNDATPAQQLAFPPVNGFFDHPEQPESRYLWRWIAYQAPDVVLQIRGGDVLSLSTPPVGSVAAAMAGGSEMGTVRAMFGSARETDGPALLQHALKDAADIQTSEIRSTLVARASRDPLAIARVLAEKYPQTPIVSYIPSVAWANTLRLADITKDDALRQKVVTETRPWTSGQRPLFGDHVLFAVVIAQVVVVV